MWVRRLCVRDLRIIHSADLDAGPGLNLVLGANASGKTSLLEAIHLVCTGRSFRSRRAEEFISRGAEESVVHAEMVGGGSAREASVVVPVGVEKRPHGTRIRVAAADVRNASVLARRFPLLVVPPDSQRLVFDGADLRRRLLDWGLFHVEHDYVGAHQSYRRVLRQRNAELRRDPHPAVLASWNAELEETAARLHTLRAHHLQRMLPRVAYLASTLASMKVSIHYYPGWDTSWSFAEALAAAEHRDRGRGYTGQGPHRADLRIEVGDRPAAQVVSRGEAKLICFALWLAEAQDFQAETGETPIVLIDDLAAELDSANRQRVFSALNTLGGQSFVTSVSEALLEEVSADLEGFHVERGKVRKMV